MATCACVSDEGISDTCGCRGGGACGGGGGVSAYAKCDNDDDDEGACLLCI